MNVSNEPMRQIPHRFPSFYMFFWYVDDSDISVGGPPKLGGGGLHRSAHVVKAAQTVHQRAAKDWADLSLVQLPASYTLY